MKKVIIFLIVLTVLFFNSDSFATTGEGSKTFSPYFDMTLSEGAFIPSDGNFFSGGNINTQVGLLTKVNPSNSIFGLYNLRYSGPGFQPQDSKQFQDRSLSHGFNVEYRRDIIKSLKIRPGISYSKEYRRTGANEAWESGLYNMDSFGGQLAADYYFDFDRDGILTFQYLTRDVKFPNYTDLLREFQGAGYSSEVSGGLQDQTLNNISIRPKWNKFFGGLTYIWQDYKNERVIDSNGTYGATRQKDENITLDFGFHHILSILEMYPVISYTMHTSNQNYVRYKYLGASSTNLLSGSSDVTFIKGNYNYNELNLNIPVDLLITSKWAISGGINIVKRDYTDRPPRNSNNNYDFDSRQSNTLTTISGGIRKQLNDISLFRINYSLIVGSSNNTFEKYLPYNYTGNSISIAYQITY